VLGHPAKDAVIIWIYSSKLDPATEKERVKSLGDPSNQPTLTMLSAFLGKRVKQLDASGAFTSRSFQPSAPKTNKGSFHSATKAQVAEVAALVHANHVLAAHTAFDPVGVKRNPANCANAELATQVEHPPACSASRGSQGVGHIPANVPNPRGNVTKSTTVPLKCPACKKLAHHMSKCVVFKELTVGQKIECVKKANHCLNCLFHDHMTPECPSENSCEMCDQCHHTLLHEERPSHKISGLKNAYHSAAGKATVVLATAKVTILDFDGVPRVWHTLLDSGSQSTFVSEKLLRELGFLREPDETYVSGLGDGKSQKVNGKVSLILQTRSGHGVIEVEALILQKVTGFLPSKEIDISSFAHIQDVDSADTTFHIPQQVDMLLGTDVYNKIVLSGKSRNIDGFPLQKTIFGEAISGPLIGHNVMRPSSCGYVVTTGPDQTGINKFWEEEEIVGTPHLQSGPCPEKHQSADEKLAEKIYADTTRVAENGRIIVKLPFKSNGSQLGYSYAQARKRLDNLWVKFKKNHELVLKYAGAFQELIDNDFVERVPLTEQPVDPSKSYYIPHHCVEKDLSTTTKLRIVFDGSAKTSSGQSINDLLLIGPTIQENIYNLMIRFRWHITFFEEYPNRL
jgi:hypothetical protein